ncbi:MAG: tail fiber domain-containing protein, partial [Patescibacteria group bacterium]|nr:tail fiber domain-containing protein [Patescibacteria group bacterium]
GRNNVSNNQGVNVYIRDDGRISVSWFNSGWRGATSTIVVPSGKSNIGVAINSNTLEVLFSVDGNQEIISMPISLVTSNQEFRVGARYNTSVDMYFDGVIDELRISDGIVRSSAWLKADYYSNEDNLNTFIDASSGGSDDGLYYVDADGITSKLNIWRNSNVNTYFNDGYVGIGTTSPSAQLHTTGTVRFANLGAGTLQTDVNGNLSVSSDERLKNVQGNFNRGLDDLLNINPISFTWKDETGYDTENMYYGFSAQNINNAIPEAVGIDKKGYLTLSDRPILATAINAIKEQNLNIISNTLQTDTNITNLKQLQISVDENLTNIQTGFTDLYGQNTVLSLRADGMENDILALQGDANVQADIITEIQDTLEQVQSGMDILAQIDTRILTIDPDKLLYTNTDPEGNITLTLDGIMLVGTLRADNIETNRLTMRADDVNSTVGKAIICPVMQTYDSEIGECIVDDLGDGKSIFIRTTSVTGDSHIFITPHGDIEQLLSIAQIRDGEGFVVKTKEIVEKMTLFDWMIVDGM